ncbi:MAG: DNA replication/repair protein RecF [Bacteroidaceae bacterium]|nr:DNA replication/repair protein RecF [Bacteroidaceae bacterium]
MILKHLSIINYRNIASCELDLSPKINCFLGMNGEGKTNLLDAIYFLSLCRSSATSQDSLCILHDQDIMSIAGQYENEEGTFEDIHIGIRRGQKKIVRRGKKTYKRLVEHIGLIPLVMVSPADHLLIAGGSEERRRFMDIIISQYNPTYMESLLRYNKALLQRNALLKEEIEPDPEMFLLWEEQMAKEAEIIFQCRQKYIQDFTPIFQRFYNHISKQKEAVELRYTSHCQRGPLLAQLTENRFRDHIVGYSLHGVHKDDLEMLLGGYAIKREGSQGQNKTFLIALKLAQFDFLKRTGSKTTPLLLLDDIFDKLDAERVEQIVSLVNNELFGQIFITDTNREHLDNILQKSNGDYCIFHVKDGNVTA